jgi:triacylglycerol esterase/lipase EstA (alpha/beta hydrolase family)
MTARLTRAALVLATGLGLGCATPIGVERSDERHVYRTNNESVLSEGTPSVASRQVLLRLGLFDRFDDEPEAVLEDLHARALAEMSPALLFALSEYAELHAEDAGSRAWHLAAALYAYAYLFPEDGTGSPDPFDARLRTAASLYNYALARALTGVSGAADLAALALPPHVGTLEVAFDESELVWAERRLTDLQPTANLEVRGLRNRYRRPGIGATFAALAAAPDGAELDPVNALVAPRMRLALAVFLRFEAPRAGLREGTQRATLEIYNARDDDEIEVVGRRVPLEFETSAALALTLDDAPVWDTEIAGFRNPMLLSEGGFLRTWGRHTHGRIPLVLVHGTASSPARWAELVNELESDVAIRQRYEFWLFTYATGQPILYSASLLREALRDAVATLDPHGGDPGLRRMVIAGHSQGGLLCKLLVVSTGTRFWDAITEVPFDQIELAPERRELLRKALFLEPLPFVERVIFISTPQRGSFLAGNWLGRIASSLTSAPQNLVGIGVDIARAGIALPGHAVDLAREGVDTLQGDEQGRVLRQLERMPSSVDNMNPKHRFIRTISSMQVEPPVVAHSIIPVKGGPPPDGQNDGVVEYSSAHVDEVETELVVFHSSHSVQSHPDAIQEVRRILLEHLAAE